MKWKGWKIFLPSDCMISLCKRRVLSLTICPLIGAGLVTALGNTPHPPWYTYRIGTIRTYECLWGSWGSYIWHYLQERKSEVSKQGTVSVISSSSLLLPLFSPPLAKISFALSSYLTICLSLTHLCPSFHTSYTLWSPLPLPTRPLSLLLSYPLLFWNIGGLGYNA